ncbi:MAG: sulfatase-like hydrolase/transferase, partial [Alistipes sp.]|nr:sulfatase-like hydrolase/transferase [Alistipes sp.]
LSLMAAGCSSSDQKSDDKNSQRPNIVLFLADDIGAECFGCMGGVSYDTHTIDSLARTGIFYTNMHAQPLSAPSRVQLMTGLYNDKNYVCFGYMNDDEPTFSQLAQEAGYTTGMFGKWQLGRSREMPTKLGWDEWCLYQLEVYKEFNGPTGTDRYANCMMDNHGHYEYSTYGPDGFEQAAFEFLDEQKDSDKPFLMYYTTPLVHTPHTPTPDSESWDLDFLGRFKGNTDNFPDMVAYLDKKVDRMIKRLKENGQWDNTIFIFTSDNGTSTRIVSELADGTMRRGGKGDPRGVGTSVPLIICWGDKVAPHVSERLVDFTDFFPTFADAMQIEVPEEWGLDGVSLYQEIAGGQPLEKEISLMHFNPLWPVAPAPYAARAARTTDYKYYWDGRFYNTKEDFMEEHPIAIETCSDEVKAIYAKLKAKVDELPGFYPDMPGAPRRGNYGTFYDFAEPNNPF